MRKKIFISIGLFLIIFCGVLRAQIVSQEGAEVYIGIEDMHCGDMGESIPNRNNMRDNTFLCANRWSVLTNYYGTYGYPYWVEDNYYVVKDTIVGNFTYQLLSNDKGCIRYSHDGKKFYYLSKSGEYLLCDFSLQVGDTCFAYIGSTAFKDEEDALQEAGIDIVQPWIVTSREIIDQRVHMGMRYVGEGEEWYREYETEMIQGIGSNHFIFPMQTSLMFEGGAPLYTLCAFDGEEEIYSFDLTEQGIKNICPNWEMNTEGVETIPIENTSATKILHNGQILILREGEIYTVFGQRRVF